MCFGKTDSLANVVVWQYGVAVFWQWFVYYVVYFATAVWLEVYCYHNVDKTADSYGLIDG